MGYQPVSNRQQNIVLRRSARIEIVLQGANGKATNNVDKQNENARYRVTANKLGRAVHCPVELRLGSDAFPTLNCLLLGNQAGIEIGIDGHLLAGHGIECEARGNFRHPARSFGDHNEVDDHQNREQHQTHGKAAAYHKLTEGLDDLSGRSGAGVAIEQDNPGGGHIEPQPHQRGNQQNGWEHTKIQGPC